MWPELRQNDGVVESTDTSPIQWVSSSQLTLAIPSGAGSGVGLAVVLRTGTVATGLFSYSSPVIRATMPTRLTYGEPRPLIACGTGMGTGLPVARTIAYGGILCDTISDLSLEQADVQTEQQGYGAISSAVDTELQPITSCLLCTRLSWDHRFLARLEAWTGLVSVRVADQLSEYSGVTLSSAPVIVELEA